MQIHEITQTKLDEGLGSFLGKAAGSISNIANKVTGAVSPAGDFKNAYANKLKTQQTAILGKKVAQIWANYAEQLKATTTDPARYATMYQQALTAFVQKNLLSGQSINSAINKQEITQLISQISAAKDNPQQVATLIPKLVQQASVSQQDVTGGQTLTKVISTDPAVIEYRGATFAVNDNGEWSNQKTGKVLDQSFQAFFDQELIKAGGSAPAPGTAPATATTPDPRRVSRTRGGK
jgi:cytidylate kinase